MGIRDTKSFRILLLDSGGTWALIQARVLMDIYGPDTPGQEILKDFDLVAANSGGSIVAGGLIANKTPTEILSNFTNQKIRESIFVELPWYKRLLRIKDIGYQFSIEGKKNGLSQALSGIPYTALSKLQIKNRDAQDVQFLIMGYDYDRDRSVIFRSNQNSRAANFPRGGNASISVLDAIHASSTAPVQYFDDPALAGTKRYWDGAVSGFNNPVLVAVTEAIANNVSKNTIGVLSIGTGNTFLPTAGNAAHPSLLKQRENPCLANDIHKMAESILADPPDTASFIAHLMLGGNLPDDPPDALPFSDTPIIRMNPLIRPRTNEGKWDFPSGYDADGFMKLVKLDMAAVKPGDVDRINRFCNEWMINERITDGWQNQPLRHGADMDGNLPNLHFCEIGHPTYSAAKKSW